MRIVLVIGEQECSKCRKAKKILGKIVEEYPSVEWVTLRYDEPEAAEYGIVMSPTVIVDNTIIASGRAPNQKRLTAFIEASL